MDKAFIIFIEGLPSSGKSALIENVVNNTDIVYLPTVSTRPLFENEDNYDKHCLTEKMFERKKQRGKIKLVGKQGDYDCGVYVENLNKNVIYITDYFSPDFRDLFPESLVIYIKPISLEYGKMKMLQKETNPMKYKKRLAEYDDLNENFDELNRQGIFDEVFINNYKQSSLDRFLDLIIRLERQIKHEYCYNKIENF